MTRPNRATTAGRAYLDLLARARREGRPGDELLTLYVLERFLFRLSVSAYSDQVVLKGGMLLAAFGRRRPTRDIDLLAKAISNDVASVAALIGEIAALGADDGVMYETGQMTTTTIRELDLYTAVRVTVPARVNRARHPLRIDVNVGDPVTPAPEWIRYPALLDEPFPVLAYPIETVLAEKLVTMVARGDTTTRDRDFADVLLLARQQDIDAANLAKAITATAGFRQIEMRPVRHALRTLGKDRQLQWQNFLSRIGFTDVLPSDFCQAIREVSAFGDPVINSAVTSGHWDHLRGEWTSDSTGEYP